LEKLEGRRKNVRQSGETKNCLGSFSIMIKYGRRGSNLALFFPRRGILQVKTSKAEMRVILVLNRDQLIEGGVIVEKDTGGIRKSAIF